VGGVGDRVTVSAIGDISGVRALEARLGAGLALFGLLVIPFATRVGRLLSRRALAPLTGLVGEIRALPSDRADRRLPVPDRAVAEVAELADAFNDVLGRLDASLETMRRFTEDASHEIRNPLAVMRTGLEVLLRKERPLAEYRALSRENLEEIVRLQSILDGLLLLARAEPERERVLQRETVDVARLAREIATRFAIVATERRAPVVVDAAAPAVVDGDARLLQLVLFNLIDNALKHGAEGHPVRVEVAAAAGSVRLAVENQGSPIPVEARSRLFERYDRPGAEVVAGVGGLGLSVVRWAAEAHAGEARYVATETGNRFEVELRSATGSAPLS
jgi:signal transduction histidine kinase